MLLVNYIVRGITYDHDGDQDQDQPVSSGTWLTGLLNCTTLMIKDEVCILNNRNHFKM